MRLLGWLHLTSYQSPGQASVTGRSSLVPSRLHGVGDILVSRRLKMMYILHRAYLARPMPCNSVCLRMTIPDGL